MNPVAEASLVAADWCRGVESLIFACVRTKDDLLAFGAGPDTSRAISRPPRRRPRPLEGGGTSNPESESGRQHL